MINANELLEKLNPNEKINYHKMLLQLVEVWQSHKEKPKILLHSCCAPCSTYTLEFMCQYAEITILFANSNIHPESEYLKRSLEQQKFIQTFNHNTDNQVKYMEEPYNPNDFYKKIKGNENEPEGGKRCEQCFAYRLDIVAKKAMDLNFDYFGSTLTISPHKNSKLINKVGFKMQNIYATKYLPSDFKKNNGYKRSIEMCNEYDIYRQCYCGCLYTHDQSIKGVNDEEKNRSDPNGSSNMGLCR